MEDIISKYKREKRIRNISILVTSLALAIGMNLFFSNTDIGSYLKASVVNNQVGINQKADLYLENVKESGNIMISLKTSNEMYKVKSISFSLFYNKDNVSIKDKKMTLANVDMVNLVENEGYNTLILNFKDATDIKVGESILNIVVDKKDATQKESLQLINLNMTDIEGNLFTPTSSGIEF